MATKKTTASKPRKPHKKSAKMTAAARINGKKGGRPKFDIDWREFDKLCLLQCTLDEFAGWFGCSEDTIERAVKRERRMGFAEYLKQKRAGGKVSLRRAQWVSALSGDKTLLIWLGKQYLGQVDSQKIEQNIQATSKIIYLPDNKR